MLTHNFSENGFVNKKNILTVWFVNYGEKSLAITFAYRHTSSNSLELSLSFDLTHIFFNFSYLSKFVFAQTVKTNEPHLWSLRAFRLYILLGR